VELLPLTDQRHHHGVVVLVGGGREAPGRRGPGGPVRDETAAAATAHLHPGGAALPRDHPLAVALVPHQVASLVLL